MSLAPSLRCGVERSLEILVFCNALGGGRRLALVSRGGAKTGGDDPDGPEAAARGQEGCAGVENRVSDAETAFLGGRLRSGASLLGDGELDDFAETVF